MHTVLEIYKCISVECKIATLYYNYVFTCLSLYYIMNSLKSDTKLSLPSVLHMVFTILLVNLMKILNNVS